MSRGSTVDDSPSLASRLMRRVSEHHTPIYAAAVAFFGFVALVPALVATLSITSLVADGDDLVREAETALEAAPDETREFLVSQLRAITESDRGGVGVAAAVGVALALFSASGAVGNLMTALNRVFGRDENRNFVKKRAIALGLLLGAVIVLAAMVAAMAVVPQYLNEWFPNDAARAAVDVGRFVALGALMAGGLTILYRIGPASPDGATYELVPGGRRSLVSAGGLAATVLFVALSWGFGVFVRNFGSYNETYGALAGIIVMLLWLQLVALAVLIGAEIDAARREARIEAARIDKGLPRRQPEG